MVVGVEKCDERAVDGRAMKCAHALLEAVVVRAAELEGYAPRQLMVLPHGSSVERRTRAAGGGRRRREALPTHVFSYVIKTGLIDTR